MIELSDRSLMQLSRVAVEDPLAVRSLDSSQLSSSSCGSSSLTHVIVQQTLKDVIDLQQDAMRQIRETGERQKLNYVLKATYDEMVQEYENERIEHAKTQLLLQKESDKLQFALGEIQILTRHLEKEKKDHEELVKSVKLRASRESQRSDLLYSKCTQNEEIVEKQKDDLYLRENEITNLRQRLRLQKETHKRLQEDVELQKVQEQYMARSLDDKENRKRRGAS